ncbi:hypothetical protein MNBD_ACTINO02-1567 [hydrothermal vent metagenome]|uniref:Xylose-responsive transcription regulator, ROK family n=1 Tax=hydrothermal vent metagenome TaxID=652676 RepID=A0A3B0SIB5_9ZZZZ
MAPSTTVLDIRRRNRGRVLRNLLLAGESTRATLALETELSTATVTNVVSDLIAEGLVGEVGTLPSNGGRPIARLSPRGDSAYVIGADIGEHGITAELYDLSLRRIDRIFDKVSNRLADPQTIAKALGDSVGAIRSANKYIEGRLIGLGLGLPGIVDTTPDGTTAIHAQCFGWEPVDLYSLYDDPDIAVYADNGAKTMAAAEAWRGGARDIQHCIVALIGRGVGAGFIVDGTLLRGLSSSAGEWGHTKISLDGRKCACGGRGCLEAYVGGAAIMQRWQDTGAMPHGTEEEALTQLIDAADNGDDNARQVLDETVEILGAGLANLVNLFNPQTIIIGGWTGLALANARLTQLNHHTRAQALARPAQQVQLKVSQLGRDAVALGAALLPLQQLINGTALQTNRTKTETR